MANYPSDAAFTDSVKKAQKRLGSREIYARIEQGKGWNHQITAGLKGIIDQADLFYFGTASADGQPYIQHRGAPPDSSMSWTTTPSPSPTTSATSSIFPSATFQKITKPSFS
jgi:hypothetical protein